VVLFEEEAVGAADVLPLRDEVVGAAEVVLLSDDDVGAAEVVLLSDETVGAAELLLLSDEDVGPTWGELVLGALEHATTAASVVTLNTVPMTLLKRCISPLSSNRTCSSRTASQMLRRHR
jgi:hypothetical protein